MFDEESLEIIEVIEKKHNRGEDCFEFLDELFQLAILSDEEDYEILSKLIAKLSVSCNDTRVLDILLYNTSFSKDAIIKNILYSIGNLSKFDIVDDRSLDYVLSHLESDNEKIADLAIFSGIKIVLNSTQDLNDFKNKILDAINMKEKKILGI